MRAADIERVDPTFNFKRSLEVGKVWDGYVADWLNSFGECYVTTTPIRVRKQARKMRYYADKDLLITCDGVSWWAEVWHEENPDRSWTSVLSTAPFYTLAVTNESKIRNWDQRIGWPKTVYVVNYPGTHVAVANVEKTRGEWIAVRSFIEKINRERTFYVCPAELMDFYETGLDPGPYWEKVDEINDGYSQQLEAAGIEIRPSPTRRFRW